MSGPLPENQCNVDPLGAVTFPFGANEGYNDFRYFECLFPADQADALFAHCLAELAWEREAIKIFGHRTLAPRLTSWYGDAGMSYRYSGATRLARPWTQELQAVRDQLSTMLGCKFTFMLANRYRDGADCVGWHSDDERDMGKNPTIASVSLGAERRFRIKRRDGSERARGYDMTHGSVLVMSGSSQRDFKHCLARTRRLVGERINLTFREVVS